MKNLFKNKKIIITGHTGFKGSWLTLWLSRLGADILGLSIDVPTSPSHFKLLNLSKIRSKKLDISNFKLLNNEIKKFKPDFIFHLAAQAIVKKSYLNPIETFNTNVMGTVNLLQSLRENKKETISIIITSDKTYKNVEIKKGYKENDTLGGEDPYGASKSAADIAVNCYVKSFFNKKDNKNLIAVARAGNVIGGGDWSEGRLMPDCMKSWLYKKTVNIRNPNATRPWQHVLDVVNGYLSLAACLKKNKKLHGEAFNFGPNMNKNYKVIDILKKSKKNWPSIKWKIQNTNKFKENYLLNLNNSKARKIIKWKPVLDVNNTINLTIDWYKNYSSKNKNSIKNKSLKQIKDFEKLLKL
jgi:CDP-glucose 4,6-dehydratase